MIDLSYVHVSRPPAEPGAPTLLLLHGTGGNEHDLLPTAASLLLLRPGVLAGAILLRAMVPLEPDVPAVLTGSRVLLSNGRRDPIVPAARISLPF